MSTHGKLINKFFKVITSKQLSGPILDQAGKKLSLEVSQIKNENKLILHLSSANQQCLFIYLFKELPPDWEKSVSDDGKVIYINHTNNTTTYTDPRLAFATEYMETSQPTSRQRFDGSSTAMTVLHGQDLRGKYALITGANTGIGKHP